MKKSYIVAILLALSVTVFSGCALYNSIADWASGTNGVEVVTAVTNAVTTAVQ